MPAWCRPCAKCPRSRRSWGCRLSVLAVLLVAPRVFRAPEGPAAREARASLRSAPCLEARPCPPDPPAPSTPAALRCSCVAGCVVLKPGQAPQASRWPPIGRGVRVLPGHALPPLTVTAARSRRPRGGLQSVGVSVCCPAMPCRRSPSPLPGPVSGDSPVPSGPSGALHTSGVFVADVARRVASNSGQVPQSLRPPRPDPFHPAGLASSGHLPHS